MSVRIGEIELLGLQRVHTEDTRALVPLRGPGQLGGQFQDLGREPVTIVLEGFLLGDDTGAALEQLREAQQGAKPLAFAADVIAGVEFTDVLILDFKVRQRAGYRGHYWFSLRVREYTEPPESPGRADAAVDDAVAADADAWANDTTDASAVLQDPASLPDKVADNPALLEQMSADELTGVLGDGAASIGGRQFGDVLASVGEADPNKLGGVLRGLQKKGSLAQFIEKLAAEGVKLKDRLSRVDLAGLAGLVMSITSGTGLVAEFKAVVTKAEAFGRELAALDPLGPFAALIEGAPGAAESDG